MLTIFFTACSDKNNLPVQPANVTSRATSGYDGIEFSLLKDFVNVMNDQHLGAALNLFNDNGALVEFDEVTKEANFHQNGYYHHYSGIAEIKDWLQDELEANPHIEAVEYKVAGIYLIMDGILYYQDQVMDIQLTEQSQNGKIELLIYNIVKKKVT